MDFSALVPVLPLLMGPLVAVATQKVKEAPAIPVNTGDSKAIRATAALFAVIGSIISAWLAGTLTQLDWPQIVIDVCNAAIIYASAVAAYNHVPAAPEPNQDPQ